MDLLESWSDDGVSKRPLSPLDGASESPDSSPDLFEVDLYRDLLCRGRGHPVGVCAGPSSLVVLTSRNFLIRHGSLESRSVHEAELRKVLEARATGLWADAHASHVLVRLQYGSVSELWHAQGAWTKARLLSKLKGAAPTAACFPPPQAQPEESLEAVVGTESGALWSVELDGAGRERAALQLQLPQAGEGKEQAVVGLEQAWVGASGQADRRLIIFALAYARLYVLCGEPGERSAAALLASYARAPSSLRWVDLPVEGPCCQLSLGREGGALAEPDSVGVLAAGGVCVAPLDLGGEQVRGEEEQEKKGEQGKKSGAVAASATRTETSVLGDLRVYRFGDMGLPDESRGEAMGCPSVYFGAESSSPRPAKPGPSHSPGATPPCASLALSRHHVLLLSTSQLLFVNRISGRLAQTLDLAALTPPLRGLASLPAGLVARGPESEAPALWAGDAALELLCEREDRDVWRVHAQRGEHDLALAHCHSQQQRNAVLLALAEERLGCGDAVGAARAFGRCTAAAPSFECVCLRLADAGRRKEEDAGEAPTSSRQPSGQAAGPTWDAAPALQVFLETRLDVLGPPDVAQRTMVSTWIVELLLDRIHRAALHEAAERGGGLGLLAWEEEGEDGEERQEGEDRGAVEAQKASEPQARDSKGNPPQLGAPPSCSSRALSEQLRSFLESHASALDPGTTISLLEAQGRVADVAAYCLATGDLDRVVDCLRRQGQGRRALQVLRRPDAPPSLALKYAPALAALAPAEAVSAWLAARPPLAPAALLPALLELAQLPGEEGPRQALRYIRAAAERLGEEPAGRALHNLAVDLLSRKAAQEPELLDYVARARNALGSPLFDPVYALRLARERGRLRAAVQLFCQVGLHEDAIETAFSFDTDLAVRVARRTEGDVGLSRRLWLLIARHVVGEVCRAERGDEGEGEVGEDGQAGQRGQAGQQGQADQQGQASSCQNSSSPPQRAVQAAARLMEDSGGVLRVEDVLGLFPGATRVDAFRECLCAALEASAAEAQALRADMLQSAETAQAMRRALAELERERAAEVDPASERCARCGRPLQAPPPRAPQAHQVPRFLVFPTGNAFHGHCAAAAAREAAPAAQRRRIDEMMARLEGRGGGDVASALAEFRLEVGAEDPYWGECVVRLVGKPFVLPQESDVAALWEVN